MKVKVVEADRTPETEKETLANAATRNLESWHFDRGAADQAIEITYSYKIDPSLSPAFQTDVKWELPTQIVICQNPSK